MEQLHFPKGASGAGGAGGGGSGGAGTSPGPSKIGVCGTTNTGGGGGGAMQTLYQVTTFNPGTSSIAGAAGGPGIVVLRVPTSGKPAGFAVAPGTNTTFTDGSATVAVFTVTGTLTL